MHEPRVDALVAISGTDLAFGFDTAVAIAPESIDRLYSTAAPRFGVKAEAGDSRKLVPRELWDLHAVFFGW
jgi:hypothetical protein